MTNKLVHVLSVTLTLIFFALNHPNFFLHASQAITEDLLDEPEPEETDQPLQKQVVEEPAQLVSPHSKQPQTVVEELFDGPEPEPASSHKAGAEELGLLPPPILELPQTIVEELFDIPELDTSLKAVAEELLHLQSQKPDQLPQTVVEQLYDLPEPEAELSKTIVEEILVETEPESAPRRKGQNVSRSMDRKKPSSKYPDMSKKLIKFNQDLDKIFAGGMTGEIKVAPLNELQMHSDIMDAMFYLLKTRCYVINERFANYLRDLTQILMNIVVDDNPAAATILPIIPSSENNNGSSNSKNDDYEVEEEVRKHKKRKREASLDSVAFSLRNCHKISREITYQLDGDGIPSAWFHYSKPDRIINIAPPRNTLLEKVLYMNPVIEGLWQVFLFTATACNDELRKERYSVDDFVDIFILSFGPTLKEYWLDDKNQTLFYQDVFQRMDYNREIQKIKACNYAYQTRNPDFIVPRRPFPLPT